MRDDVALTQTLIAVLGMPQNYHSIVIKQDG